MSLLALCRACELFVAQNVTMTDPTFLKYPPASTQEGYDGLYGIDVFSICINEIQNTAGGRQLGKLYGRGSRALSAGTSFIVRVTNLDCNTVDPADPGPIQNFRRKSLEPRQSQQGQGGITWFCCVKLPVHANIARNNCLSSATW